MISSDGENSDDHAGSNACAASQILKPLAVLKKITKMRRQVKSSCSWIYQLLKEAEGEMEQEINARLERCPAHMLQMTAPRQHQAQAAAPPLNTHGSSRRGNGGTSTLTVMNPPQTTRAPRHPSRANKRYDTLRIPMDKCKRKAKS